MGLSEQITTDLEKLFAEDLAIDVVHQNGQTQETIRAFFNIPQETLLEGILNVNSARPEILIQTSDMTNIDLDSSFTIAGTVYKPLEISPDEEGITRITLSEDDDL